MKVTLQKTYWNDVLGALKATRVILKHYFGEDERFRKELENRLNIIITEIERQMEKKKP